MRDGIAHPGGRLSARGLAEGETVPAILGWSPYGKHNLSDRLWPPAGVEPGWISKYTAFEAPDPAYWCPRGYAIVYPDPRGTWYSQGEMNHGGAQEGDDVYDLIEWIGTQPWCNGRVGMSGVSYLACTQYQVAPLQPAASCRDQPVGGLLRLVSRIRLSWRAARHRLRAQGDAGPALVDDAHRRHARQHDRASADRRILAEQAAGPGGHRLPCSVRRELERPGLPHARHAGGVQGGGERGEISASSTARRNGRIITIPHNVALLRAVLRRQAARRRNAGRLAARADRSARAQRRRHLAQRGRVAARRARAIPRSISMRATARCAPSRSPCGSRRRL